jgi:hypothetical protein
MHRPTPHTLALWLLLLAAHPAAAQDAERQLLRPGELPGPTPYRDPTQHARALATHALRLRVTPKPQPYITTLGDPSIYGAATLILPPGRDAAALVTGEFFVRDAATIEILWQGRALPTAALRADQQLGLAELALPDEIAARLAPAPLRDTPLLTWDRLFVLLFDKDGVPLVAPVLLHGPGEPEELSFYTAASPTVGEGHPIFDQRGAVVGIFALRLPVENKPGYALLTAPLARFLDPAAPAPGQQPLPFEVLGGARPAPEP